MAVYYLYATMRENKVKEAQKAVSEGNLDTALNIFMDSLRRDPNNIDTLWHLGNINEEKGNILEAIGYYNQILRLGVKSNLFTDFEIYRRMGVLYRKVERDKDALDHLMQAYQLLPTNKDVLEHIAYILFSQKQFYRAFPFFEKAANSLTDNPEFMKKYGFCQMMMDNINDSVSTLEEARRLNPSDHETKYFLAYLNTRTGSISKTREYIEDILNIEKVSLTVGQIYYAMKMLFVVYMQDKNFEVARDLYKKLESMSAADNDIKMKQEIDMAYVFMRARQGYFDLALEKFDANLDVGIDLQGVSENDQEKIKQNKSVIFDTLSTLNKYKLEKPRFVDDHGQSKKYDISMTILENEAVEAAKRLEVIIDQWRADFLKLEDIWKLFAPQVKALFDVTLILDKYTEESMRSMKDKFSAIKNAKPKKSTAFEMLGIDTNNPRESLINMDFGSFGVAGRELAEHMGYKVISQGMKLDPAAHAEGKGTDYLCEEKFNKNVRVIFCLRRFNDPMGMINVMDLVEKLGEYRAQKLVLISTTPLSAEAKSYVDKNEIVEFFTCDQIANYFY